MQKIISKARLHDCTVPKAGSCLENVSKDCHRKKRHWGGSGTFSLVFMLTAPALAW